MENLSTHLSTKMKNIFIYKQREYQELFFCRMINLKEKKNIKIKNNNLKNR